MRTALLLPLVAALAGCAVGVVPSRAWNFDPTQPQPKTSLAPEQAAALTDRLPQLQMERKEVCAPISGEAGVASAR